MTYHAYVMDGKVTFKELSTLPDGTSLRIEVDGPSPTAPAENKMKLREFKPVEMPGESLADDIVRDRR